LFGYLGTGFEEAYNQGGLLKKAVDAWFEGAEEGDILDVTRFRRFRDDLTIKRTEETLEPFDQSAAMGSLFQRLIYKLFIRHFYSKVTVAADSKAGDIERKRAGTSAAIDVGLIAGPSIFKGTKSVIGAIIGSNFSKSKFLEYMTKRVYKEAIRRANSRGMPPVLAGTYADKVT